MEGWGRDLGARGYFGCTTGNVLDDVIAKYIELHDIEALDDDSWGH